MKSQTSLSLVDRSKHFTREFPTAKMNPFLLAQIYKQHGIKKKKLRWAKAAKDQDQEKHRQWLIKMKR